MQDNPQILFSWKAPLRPYIRRSSAVIRFYIALAVLISLILLFFGDKIVIVPVAALLFIFYVFTVTPPPEIENRITKFGVETGGAVVGWEDLGYFFYTSRFGYDILVLVTVPPYYHHVYLVVPNAGTKKVVSEQLAKHIMYREDPQKTVTDRLVEWFSALVPNEEGEVTQQSASQTPREASPSPQASAPIASPLRQSLQYTQLPPSLMPEDQNQPDYQEIPLESPDGTDRAIL